MTSIHFTDLLAEPIEVDEVTLDASVDVWVERTSDGRYHIDSMNFEHVFVCVGDHRFEFTAEDFRTKHKYLHERFKNKLEMMALQQAVNEMLEVGA